MKRIIAAMVVAVTLSVGATTAVAGPYATITFSLATTGGIHPTCELTINSSKDISNYTVNGVKTDGVTTPSVTLSVANGDVITVKSGLSTASYTVSGCLAADPHDPHDPHIP